MLFSGKGGAIRAEVPIVGDGPPRVETVVFRSGSPEQRSRVSVPLRPNYREDFHSR